MSNSPRISLDGIAAFVRAVELGSLSAASESMGLSKSAAAKSVARLEERLGVQLLLRTTRSIALTQEGEVFFHKCRAILEDIDAAEALMSARRRDVSGTLRVSLPMSFGRLWAAPVLMALASEHPMMTLNLSFTDRYVDLFEEGIDLAIRIGSSADRTSLMTVRLADQYSLLCAAPEYIERYGPPRDLEDLTAHKCILFEHSGRLTPWRLRNGTGDAAEVSPKAHMVVSHGEGIMDAALAGYGIAHLSTWLAGGAINSGALVPVLPDCGLSDRSINILWPSRREHAPKIRVAIDALVARFSPRPPWEQHSEKSREA